MNQPPALRVREQVIEAFGVSVKYTIALAIIGAAIIGVGVYFLFFGASFIATITQGAGPLAPFIVRTFATLIILIGFYTVLRGVYLRLAYHFFLTSERVIEVTGFMAQNSVSAEYRMITDISVRQDATERLLLNTGTLAINTPGGPGEEFILVEIDSPIARREQLRRLAEAVQAGKAVDADFLAELKYETGMARSREAAFAEIAKSIGGSPLQEEMTESVHRITKNGNLDIPVSQPPINSNDLEDLHGDGVDESDRLRAAQKQLPKE